MKKIDGLLITENSSSKRIIDIKIKDKIVNNLVSLFNNFDLTVIEYKPFTRFTVAKYLDDLTNNELSKYLNDILRDRKTGCFIIGPETITNEIDDIFLVKLSTAVTHLIGLPNHDSMSGKFYARFHVKHEDKSDSYLRKAYTNLDLHTDGTYTKEITDWVMMTKIEEKNVKGGESVMLHLDDWENCKKIINDPTGRENFIWSSPKSKNVNYKVEHPVFTEDSNGLPQISYIDQFPEPKNMKQGLFLQKLSDSLERSKYKITFKLPVGSTLAVNNYFWLHGRKPFSRNKSLYRELLRIRGIFNKNN
jgi:protein CsiD